MDMVFNPFYNWGCSAKISINVRNKTFVQGKPANREWTGGGGRGQEPDRVKKGCWWMWLVKRWRGNEPELPAGLCQTAGPLTAFSLSSPAATLGAGRLVPRALTGAGKGQAMLKLKERASLFWLVGSPHLDDSWVSWIRQGDTLHGIELKAIHGLSPLESTIKREAMSNGNKWTV